MLFSFVLSAFVLLLLINALTNGNQSDVVFVLANLLIGGSTLTLVAMTVSMIAHTHFSPPAYIPQGEIDNNGSEGSRNHGKGNKIKVFNSRIFKNKNLFYLLFLLLFSILVLLSWLTAFNFVALNTIGGWAFKNILFCFCCSLR